MEKLNHKERRKVRRQLEREGKAVPEELLPQAKLKVDSALIASKKEVAISERKKSDEKKPDSDHDSADDFGAGVFAEEPLPEHLIGGGGFTEKSNLRTELRSVNWQQKNRVPIEKVLVKNKFVMPVEGELDSAGELFAKAITAIRSNDPRMIRAGMTAGVQMLKSVQLDDHAKLRAELRPTQLAPQVVVDQSTTNNDNRRVSIILPHNNRDPLPGRNSIVSIEQSMLNQNNGN